MAFAQRTVYALRAVFELARKHSGNPIPIAAIAKAQGIPPRFLESILLQLKGTGILESVRGVEGGYRLARPPENISVGDVLRVVEGNLFPISCLGEKMQENCPMKDWCVFLPMWEKANKAMLAVYDSTSFADLLNQEKAFLEESVPTFQI